MTDACWGEAARFRILGHGFVCFRGNPAAEQQTSCVAAWLDMQSDSWNSGSSGNTQGPGISELLSNQKQLACEACGRLGVNVRVFEVFLSTRTE